jgi:hypothetical protein
MGGCPQRHLPYFKTNLMARSYKVRFNLSRGKNYMKWKVEGPDGVNYYDPSSVNLIMRDCQLKNNKATAKKIHAGAHKTVCAWVRCTEIVVSRTDTIFGYQMQVSYSPRSLPHWTSSGKDNLDDTTWDLIISNDRRLLIPCHIK